MIIVLSKEDGYITVDRYDDIPALNEHLKDYLEWYNFTDDFVEFVNFGDEGGIDLVIHGEIVKPI